MKLGSDELALSVLIVNWNGARLTLECVESIRRFTPRKLAYEVLVADNGSDDTDVEQLSALESDGTRLLKLRANLGFARANNQLLRVARGRYLMLMNNDTWVRDGALAELVSYMDLHGDVGIGGPRLVNPDNSTQSSYDLFPLTPWRLAWERVADRFAPNRISTRARRIRGWAVEPDAPLDVDWLLGAAMIVRRRMTEQVGLLDEDYPMYAEDLDWCYRARKAGWRVVYLPFATVVHIGGASSVARPEVAERLGRERDTSLVRFYRQHFGWPAALGIRLVLWNHRRSRRTRPVV